MSGINQEIVRMNHQTVGSVNESLPMFTDNDLKAETDFRKDDVNICINNCQQQRDGDIVSRS